MLAVAPGGRGAAAPEGVPPNAYYTFDGSGLQRIENQDPKAAAAERWEVWLFRPGSAPDASGRGRWGVSEGKSAEAVLKELARDQEAELRFNQWAGRGRVPDEFLTYFNPLGPIAIVPGPVQSEKPTRAEKIHESLSRLHDLADQVKELKEGRDRIAQILGREAKEPNPSEHVGDVLKEYTDLVGDAELQIKRLDRSLQSGQGRDFDALEDGLRRIGKNIDQAAARGRSLRPPPEEIRRRTRELLDGMGAAAASVYGGTSPADAFRQMHLLALQVAAWIGQLPPGPLGGPAARLAEATNGPGTPENFRAALKIMAQLQGLLRQSPR